METKNTDNSPVLASDQGKAALSAESVTQNNSDEYINGSGESYHTDTSDTNKEISPLLGLTLQVPGFTLAEVAVIDGEWVHLYGEVNNKDMCLHRKVADVAAWLGVELAPALPVFAPGDVVTVAQAFEYQLWTRFVLHYKFPYAIERVSDITKSHHPDKYTLWCETYVISMYGSKHVTIVSQLTPDANALNGTDTLKVEALDPVVIDEPAIDPDDTEIIPCPDVAEWEDLRGLNVTPWVSAGETDFTEPQDAYINGAKLDALEVKLVQSKKQGWTITLKNTTDEQRHRAMEAVTNALVFGQAIKEPLAEKQALEERVKLLGDAFKDSEYQLKTVLKEAFAILAWLDERFIPYSKDGVSLTTIDRLNEHEAWLIEELAAAREQLEALRSGRHQDALQAPTTSAAGQSNPDISAHQTGLIYGDEAA